MESKKQYLIQQIRQKYEEKFGNNDEIQKIINEELNTLSIKQKITLKDFEEIETKIDRINYNFNQNGQNKRLASKSIDRSKSFLQSNHHHYHQRTASLKKVNETDNDENTLKIFQNPIKFAKAMNSDLNGMTNEYHEHFKSTNHITSPNMKSSSYFIGNSILLHESSSELRNKHNHNSSINSNFSPEKKKLHELEKAKKIDIWGKLQDYEFKEHLKVQEDIKIKLKERSKLFSETLAKQIENQKKFRESAIKNEKQFTQKMIEEEFLRFQKEEEDHKKNLQIIRNDEKKTMEESMKLRQDQQAEKTIKKKLEYERIIEEEIKYKQEMEEAKREKQKKKSLLREMQQKDLEEHANLQKTTSNTIKAEEKQYVKDLIENLNKQDMEGRLFYEKLRERAKLNIKDKEHDPKGQDARVYYKKKKKIENVNTSLVMAYQPIDYQKKYQTEKDMQNAQIKQIEERNQKDKEYKNFIDEQKDLWKIQEDEMEAREAYLKEIDKAKKLYIKQELENQIIQRDMIRNESENARKYVMNRRLFRKLNKFYNLPQ